MNRIATGFQDKHGKEIFIGDIVRAYSGAIIPNYAGNEKVILRDGHFYLDNEDGLSDLEYHVKNVEIVGNIHDNPDLFKDGFRMSFWSE